jgi:sugar phosphate isomerase/epimerase
MKIGLITDSVSHLPFERVLDLAKELGLSSVEVATGNWSEAPHADLSALVSSEEARAEFIDKISSRGLALSALTANGNQLHPTSGKQQDLGRPRHDRGGQQAGCADRRLDVGFARCTR